MPRHIIDKAPARSAALPRFLLHARRATRTIVHAPLARAPRLRDGAVLLSRFCRIDRRGLGKV